ncbi:MAG: aminotransferase class V-fold PLP-dependent enzyme [Bacteroidia bacterium]|nr:aminotransferase class V-fold PLP-dependent enzyme [Bacteroidia bacterium]
MLTSQKHLFYLPEDIYYLNNATKAPMLIAAEKAAQHVLEKQKDPSYLTSQDFFTEVSQVKSEFAKLIGAQGQDIAIIPSVSYGMSTVLHNIKARPGQQALTLQEEFPSSVFSLKRWCQSQDIELRMVGPEVGSEATGEEWNRRILEALNEDTAVLIMSAIHWMNGICFDLKAIGARCKELGIKFIVDGTQFVGACPLKVEDIQADALICASYKWMLGPYSLGLAYYGSHFEGGTPIEESWMNRTNSEDFSGLTSYDPVYAAGSARYSVGESSHFLLMPMLLEALKQLNSWGIENMQAYVKELVAPLIQFQKNLGMESESGPYFSSHLFGLKMPKQIDLEQFRIQLKENRVITALRGNSLRVSVNVFNEERDMQKLMEMIEQAAPVRQ